MAFDPFRGFQAASSIASKVTDPREEERKSQRELQTYEQKKAIDARYGTKAAPTALDEARAKKYTSDAAMTEAKLAGTYRGPTMMRDMNKATSEIYNVIGQNKVKRNQITKGREALTKLPTGPLGAANIKFKNWTNSKDPILKDWQNLKSVLTDAQLMYTAQTKGAISDEEMELFRKAVANDEIVSPPKMEAALDKLLAHIEAEDNAKIISFKQNYGEDPMQWEGMGGGNPIQQAARSQSPQMGQSSQYKVGDTRVVNNVTYRKAEDGGWDPI